MRFYDKCSSMATCIISCWSNPLLDISLGWNDYGVMLFGTSTISLLSRCTHSLNVIFWFE